MKRNIKRTVFHFLALSLGTGVTISAGVFSLTGQMAEHASLAFPFAFLAEAIIVSFTAYSNI